MARQNFVPSIGPIVYASVVLSHQKWGKHPLGLPTTTSLKDLMSDSNTQVRSGGISFTGMIATLFIGLKLTGYIDWSWWWVLSPLWIPIAVILGIAAAILAFAAIVWCLASLIDAIFTRKPKQNKFRGL